MQYDKVLDITKYKTLTEEALKERIVKDVQKTQSESILMPLPNIIRMRVDQYVILQDDEDMLNMFDSEDRLYRTLLNVMEVRINTEGEKGELGKDFEL